MRSYFLEGARSREAVTEALCELLPGQVEPWLLMADADDPVAYLHVDGAGTVQADLSGRHSDQAVALVGLLATLQQRTGGTVSKDD